MAQFKRSARVKWWRGKKQNLRVATWNVRSLVENMGSIETASRRRNVVEDKKIVRVVDHLKRYDIDIAGIQETHWFGDETYNVEDRLVLTSGRPVPCGGESCRRGEGVALVLNKMATEAWRAGGCIVERFSSRLMYARFKFSLRNGGAQWVRVICAYAPTFRSTRRTKEVFYADVQAALNDVHHDEDFILVGDFNARIGSRTAADEWSAVRGPHGWGQLNSSGEELLNFLSLNQATVCNTWFAKKNNCKQTWQHPRTKQWHCIDFIVTAQAARHRCLDAQVIKNAECSSDHALLAMKFALNIRRHHGRHQSRGTTKPKPFDIEKMRHSTPDDTLSVTEEFQRLLSDSLRETPPDGLSLSQKWDALRDSLVSTADATLGRCQRNQPDWYRDNSAVLAPLLAQRNQTYADWVVNGRQDDAVFRKFKTARKVARAAVRRAQTDWFEKVAVEAELSRFDGMRVWKCIRALQRATKGLVPVKVNVIKDECGIVCSTVAAQHQRWRRHFSTVLNIPSRSSNAVLEAIPQRDVEEALGVRPSLEEVQKAIAEMKNGKAAGSSSIISEIMKAGGLVFANALLTLLDSVWEEERVPQDWVDSILVPIPKKGDLSRCDNWRGISLLDVVGKAVARLVQTRLQKLAERVLPESQCGFRRQRSCTDMIFSVRQLVEKTLEHHTKAFLVFVDLKKAYDSIPRNSLWMVLSRLGVPSKLVNIIRAFHEDMSTRLRLDGTLQENISVQNGLRQGCTMAPVLFNLYMCAVIECWLDRLDGADGVGVDILVRYDGELLRKSRQRTSTRRLTECQFADDAALIATSRNGMERVIAAFVEVASDFGLTVSFTKTKFMAIGVGLCEAEKLPVVIGDSTVEHVDAFRYLGSQVDSTGRSSLDICTRVATASKAFGALRQPVFKNVHLSIATKRHVFSACVLSLLLYSSECWVPLQQDVRRLSSYYNRCIRSILGISKKDVRDRQLTNAELLELWGDQRPLQTILTQRRLEWLGHVARMPEHRMPKALLFGLLRPTRPPGGPRKRWRDCVRTDLKKLNALSNWHHAAHSRPTWRLLCRELKPPSDLACGVSCRTCHREFARPSDFKRHKCADERRLPVQQQRGAVQCRCCRRWFKSAGGMAVHKCSADAVVSTTTEPSVQTLQCERCQRSFASSSGMKRHKCVRTARKTVTDREAFQFVCGCGRRFRRQQDITRHQRVCSE